MEIEKEKQNARLEDWYLGEDDMLFGTVYGHPKIPDGEHVVTSRVVFLDLLSSKAVTKNTNYDLGKRREVVK